MLCYHTIGILSSLDVLPMYIMTSSADDSEYYLLWFEDGASHNGLSREVLSVCVYIRKPIRASYVNASVLFQ